MNRMGPPTQEAEIRFTIGRCSLGLVLVAYGKGGICAILLGDDLDALAREVRERFPRAQPFHDDARLVEPLARVVAFMQAPDSDLGLELDPRGTAFQRRVWQALRAIPAGKTASYKDIASRIGSPKAVRAVARACAANAIAVAIPCHRVVRNDGGLSGYRWGAWRKRMLLEKEAAA